jgi:hypothetical protein
MTMTQHNSTIKKKFISSSLTLKETESVVNTVLLITFAPLSLVDSQEASSLG